MITFSKLGQRGRLGNQLFQIASTIGIAKLRNDNYSFPNWDESNYFRNNLPKQEEDKDLGRLITEPYFHADTNFFKSLDNTNDWDLDGYYQSEKYFEHCKEYIKNQFKFKPEFVEQVRTYYDENEVFNKPTIAISIRRGDYVNNESYLQLPITYFFNALIDNFTYKNFNIIIFSDDIPYCKVHLSFADNVYFSEGNSAIEDLCLMTQCTHFIISNSTFSWWGAWLGENKNKIVIRPNGLFAGKLEKENNIKDFYPNNWKIATKNKINLMDTTFTIPVMFDHEDRAENLHLCIAHILKHFDTNVTVMEEISNIPTYGRNKLYESIPYKTKVEYSECNHGVFHRTKMLNDMMMQSFTPYIANWDADVLISPISIYFAIKKLREDNVTMVFPYKWAFARIPRKPYYNNILWTIDIGVVGDTTFNGMLVSDVESFGGAVIVNKQAFSRIGGENENFISFGAEDTERVIRTKKLGHNIDRSFGVLYHIQHYVGPDSSPRNPYFIHNKKEYEKVRDMTKGQLENYITTWETIK